MKDLAIINSLESGIWTAKRAFTAAVVENLKEIGKVLTIVGDGDNSDAYHNQMLRFFCAMACWYTST